MEIPPYSRAFPREPGHLHAMLRMATVLLFAVCMHVAASARAQDKITLSEKDAALDKVFYDIQKQTSYTFLYHDDMIALAKRVTIEVEGASLEEVLRICFKGQPLTFTMVGNAVVVRKRDPAGQLSDILVSNKEVHGTVVSESGDFIPQATVMIKGTKIAVSANEKGEFTLKNIDENAIIEISSVGYETMVMAVKGRGEIGVTLKRKDDPLDEVQVIAYGTTSRRLSTGDVTTISGAEIEKQPVDNVLLALEGRVPGMFITQSTGLPGSTVAVQIRGQNSIANGNDPFYVIDGVPYVSQLLPNLGFVLGSPSVNDANSGSPLGFINPSDIESVSILKDADATAIYGSRAANGAVLITTKRGKAGQTKVDFNLQDGVGQVDRYLSLMNAQQYLQMRHEALANDGLSISPTDYDINGTWDTTHHTNWQKALIGGIAQYINVSGNASGGNTAIQYLIGGTYHKETTVFPEKFADQRGSVHFNINSVSSDKRFRISFTGNYMVDDNHLPNNDLTAEAIKYAPTAPPVYNNDGTLNWAPTSSGSSTWYNPLSFLYDTYQNKTNNLIANAVINYQVIPSLNVKVNLGYTNMQSNETQISPLSALPPEERPNNSGGASYVNNNINSWIVEPQVSFRKAVSKGAIDILFGTTFNQQNGDGQQLNGGGYNSDLLLNSLTSAAYIFPGASTVYEYKYNAIFGRINYNWNGKYILDVTDRKDGSSRFGADNQFHDFAAIGAGWVYSQEKFFKENVPVISFGKLRASYGTTGNDQIGNYQFMNLYYVNSPGVPYQGINGLTTYNLTNPYLQWEETRKFEFSLDIGILKDKVLLNGNYYLSRSSNQLLSYNLPIITGFQGVTENFPATVENKGYEFMLTTVNIKTRYFSWSTHINLSIPQNKLIAFPNLGNSTYAESFVIGEPVSFIRVYHFLGVNPETGVFQFSDGHGGITSTPDTNSNYMQGHPKIINTAPKFYGGVSNSFRFKDFELDILFQFTKQIGNNYLFGNNPGEENGGEGNQPTTVLTRWRKAGDVTNIQRYNSNYSLLQPSIDALLSDGSFSDASFVRLKNLSASWQLPHGLLSKSHLQNVRIFVLGQNLLTFTHYVGLDPETRSSTTLPPLRILTFGLQVSL